jgi:hemoglobin-like flavoprotein
MLALELLEGKRLFNQAEGRRLSPADALAVAKNARWARRHEQLSAIVSKLLAEKPEDRFSDMEKVIASLDALEDSTRALAKYSFLTYIAPGSQGDPSGAGFAKSFYDNLFTKDEVKRVFLDAGAQEFPNKALYDKLINGLKAVLNFRPGCTPSSIDSVAKQHVGFKLNGQHFAAFKESFIETLEQEITRSDPTEEISEITNAWKNLFDPVRDEMLAYAKRHPLPPDAKAATHGG